MSVRRLPALAALLLWLAGTSPGAARALVAMAPPTRIAEVTSELAGLEPRVQACAAQTGTTTPVRLMVNVYVFPQGEWSITFGPPRGAPAVNHRGDSPFEGCVASALLQRIGPRTETFGGTRPRKISRRFRLLSAVPSVTIGPPTVGPVTAGHAAVVRRVLSSRRASIQACFPHAARAPRTEIRVRVEVASSGELRTTGLRIPSHLDFPAIAQCFERAIDGARMPSSPGTLRGEVPFTVQIDAPPAPQPTGPASPPAPPGPT